MNAAFSDTASVASVYLALIGLLSGAFFINLSQWLAGISGLSANWSKTAIEKEKLETYDRRLDYFAAKQAASPWTAIGWAVVTAFVWMVVWFQLNIERIVPAKEQPVAAHFVTLPCIIFAGVFSAGSLVMLVWGYRVAMRIDKEVSVTV